MTGNDYILCTNLAKVRIAREAFGDMLFMDASEEQEQIEIMTKLTDIMERLEKQVETEESP